MLTGAFGVVVASHFGESSLQGLFAKPVRSLLAFLLRNATFDLMPRQDATGAMSKQSLYSYVVDSPKVKTVV